MKAEVVVVGGGITGAAVAFHLARLGADVVLLERSRLASGPTGRSTAIIRQHYSQPLLVRMAVHGLRFFGDFVRETGHSCNFVRTGMLWAVDEANRAALEANVELGLVEGAEIELVEPSCLATIDGRIALDGLAACCWEPTAGHCDPYLGTAGLALASGARITEGVRVTAVSPGVVESDAGTIEADAIVVAAGPWTGPLLAPLGYDLPIVPARAEVGRFRLPVDFGPPPPAIADFTDELFYVKPADAGYVEVGTLDPSHADTPVDPDCSPEGAEADTLAGFERALGRRLPAAGGGHWRGAWSGIYDVTPDWQPVIGPVPRAEGVYVAAGFSGHGFKLAPAVGASLASLLRDGAWGPFDLDLFNPTRFARGALIGSRYGYSVVG